MEQFSYQEIFSILVLATMLISLLVAVYYYLLMVARRKPSVLPHNPLQEPMVEEEEVVIEVDRSNLQKKHTTKYKALEELIAINRLQELVDNPNLSEGDRELVRDLVVLELTRR